MALIWQIVTDAPTATTLTLQSGSATTGYSILNDGLQLGDAVWDHQYSGQRGTQGARPAQGIPQNRPLVLPVMIGGTSKDDAASKIATLSQAADELRRYGGRVKFQSTSQSYPQYFVVMSGQVALDRWGHQGEVLNKPVYILACACAPYVVGDSMDITDGFAADTINGGSSSDYTADGGALTNLSVAFGWVSPAANLTTEDRLIQTARGYSYGDHQVTVKTTPGSTITSYKAGVVLKRVDASNYLEVYVDDTGSNSRLRLDKVVAGVRTNLQSTNLGSQIVNGTPFWVRGRIEGNVVYREYFTSAPTPMGSPASAPASWPLTTGEQATFGLSVAGKAGFSWTPQQAAATLDDFKVEPYTYRNLTLPERLSLRGSVPGDAMALADVTVTPSGGSATPIWALLGWYATPAVWSRVWNGDFEEDTNGWSVAAVSGVTGAATSITRVTTASKVKYGTASGEIVTPATANTGASFAMYGRFKTGVPYTAVLWVNSAAGTTNTRLRLGVSGDIASETAAALSATLTQRTVTWTPAADADVAYVAFEVTAATATTMAIDGVQVYEGAMAPTVATQTEGRGAYPPFGIIEAESCDTGDLSTWAVTADANGRAGNKLAATTSGAGTAAATWFIDPSLLAGDDYTQGDVSVEVWARVELASTVVSPKLIASVIPSAGTSYGTQRYTDEFGSAGKLLTLPSSGTRFRMVRLGPLPLSVVRSAPYRWKLKVAASWAAGSSGGFNLDYLVLCPVRRRAVSPSGKANDGTFPLFVPSTSETAKRIDSTLRGFMAQPPNNEYPDQGLGGQLLELPTGGNDWLVKLSSLVPDDPTSDATTEQLAQSATLHVSVIPRFMMLRAS